MSTPQNPMEKIKTEQQLLHGFRFSWAVALAFVAVAGYSVYLAIRLLLAHCEGFSCTYLGMAWLFWIGVLCLPTIGLGYLASRSCVFRPEIRLSLRIIWIVHIVFSLSLGIWWLISPT